MDRDLAPYDAGKVRLPLPRTPTPSSWPKIGTLAQGKSLADFEERVHAVHTTC
jgi:hypothetical protein